MIPEKVKIESLGNRVGGIARPDGFPAVFVRGALPGELVTVKPFREKKNYIEADLVSIEEPSPHRVKPFCKYYGICGGCSLQHLSYPEQLRWKRIWVEKAIRNLDTPEVDPALPSPDKTGYRNRSTFGITNSMLTMHAFRGDPVQVEECPLMNKSAADALKEFLKAGYTDGLTGISVRGGTNTDSSALEFTGDWNREIPDGFPATAIRRKFHWECLKQGEMLEKLGDLVFPVPAGGFFQVNTRSAEMLISIVMGHAQDTGNTALDLFGGAGTFGIPLAASGKRVTTVELNREASAGCARAAELNNIPENLLRVVNLRDNSFLSKVLKNKIHFNTVVTDPPRAGMGARTTGQLIKLKPEKIIYVSCNPFSAARDIAILAGKGYKNKQVTPVDMFPHTDHIETVFLLERS